MPSQGREADLTSIVIALCRKRLKHRAMRALIPRELFDEAREFALLVKTDPITGDIAIEVTPR